MYSYLGKKVLSVYFTQKRNDCDCLVKPPIAAALQTDVKLGKGCHVANINFVHACPSVLYTQEVIKFFLP